MKETCEFDEGKTTQGSFHRRGMIHAEH